MQTVAVNKFKTRLSEFLNKMSKSRVPIYITKHGKIVAKVIPYSEQSDWEAAKKRLAGSILKYEGETEPVGEEDWEALNDPS
jgi:prevent-host-death family protein